MSAKDFREKALAQLEKNINDFNNALMESDDFNAAMQNAMNTQNRMKKAFSDQMAKNLAFYNMPSQDEIVSLAEQCGRIEERLVRVETALNKLVEQKEGKKPPASSPVPRTRKPRTKSAAKEKPKTE